ncbi:hypothetical protein [Longimicrobium sp.]|uniref:hypothetical protein n=1 Tax=Longimicrobium sp. TaxID=2029185 RepID=UPI002E30F787|nr:hypothetical protein [Longimicrobium sp.]HEX6041537.1 hypothetical protein [Longimicrobium sp.]
MNPYARAAAPLAACLASFVLAGTAHAQNGLTPLRVGQSVTGRLVESDVPVNDRGRFHAYRFSATQGQRLLVTAESEDFDTYVIVGRQVGPVLDELKTDDDGGDGTDSRMRFTVPRTGQYVLLVQAYGEDGMGAFTVGLQPAPAASTGGMQTLSLGGTEEGALADTDNEDDESGKFYDQYSFRGQEGQRVQIGMMSDEFDTYLSLGRMEDGEWQEIETDDDGGDGTNARLRYVLPSSGEYVIRATSFGEATGAYTLTLSERTASQRTSQSITAGETVESELDDDDTVLDSDNSFYETWTYQGRAGEQLRISMESDEFDTYLHIGRMVNGDWEEIATMDDGGDGTNSLLEVSLPEDGEYVIRANSYTADQTGAYTLRVDTSRDR